jgi:hypothetical protein
MQAGESDQVSYDEERHLLRFSASEGRTAISISKAALAVLEDDSLAGPHAMVITFRRNRERIQAIAMRKYHNRCIEDGEIVVVRRDDIGR